MLSSSTSRNYEKEKQIKYKVNRRKEIIKNTNEHYKKNEESTKPTVDSLRKIDKNVQT
jgi:nitric oxide reductase activation protein